VARGASSVGALSAQPQVPGSPAQERSRPRWLLVLLLALQADDQRILGDLFGTQAGAP
jgi:hypothetical protein